MSLSMSPAARIALLAMLVTVLVLAVVEPSLAGKGGTSDIGENVGNEVESWAKGLFLGCAGLVALPVLFRLDWGKGLALAGLVMVVGGFVFAPGTVEDGIQTMWETFTGETESGKSGDKKADG